MKTKSKALILAICAILLLSVSVFGTMAYLTDEKAVTNTFTVGDVEITLDEAKSDVLGVVADDTVRVEENEYHLLPGHEYEKDPTIHVADDSEDCYLFVEVLNGLATIESTEVDNVATQMAENGWVAVDGAADVYVYVGTADGATAPLAVSGGDDVVVFEKFTIQGLGLDNAELADYVDAEIVVTAYAIQKDGLTDKTAVQLWDILGQELAEADTTVSE